MSDIERELAAAMRRYRNRKHALEMSESERDEAIRAAMEAAIPRKRLAEITGLTPQRLHQIKHGARINRT